MKNLKLKILTIASDFLAMVAGTVVSAASTNLYYQPKTPKKLQK
ncbi:cyclic lactone autoinducer peptide [Tepidibacter formicigenes]|jgi:cyclic lactone autoinducer peptide|uniref:Cyclic lactone autoinducer peptide n=1 Tax=Tepidibacter formicigenes DSM 15518 TaxID=1123349 RepID=A0A1M6KP91_9FIRM|nr:cyclic lactone autoinducer peptide [Tepidibacter formicigenes]SHJ60711.1 cyclic lactone autoinducer peptide [Tepidibacter formicigenes DSM 15518]